MITKGVKGAVLLVFTSLLLASNAFTDDAFDRELVVKDQTRAMKVESVFKQLLQAYEDESPNDFLDLVSDDRFRQDYITFTDALYSDFRKYEIIDITYWIDRITSDNIKQFLYAKWEKRYINLDDSKPFTTTGYSRFLFDEVNGKYLLVELAGNSLFGGSLKEWRDEMPRISGEVQEISHVAVADDGQQPVVDDTITVVVDDECGPGALTNCSESGCNTYGGYWYNNTCNQSSEETNCSGYWYNGVCYTSEEAACTADGKFWANGTCYGKEQSACNAMGMYWDGANCLAEAPGKADLTFSNDSGQDGSAFMYTILNTGSVASTPCKMEIICDFTFTVDIPAIPAGGSYGPKAEDIEGRPRYATIDSEDSVDEGTDGGEGNNQWTSPI